METNLVFRVVGHKLFPALFVYIHNMASAALNDFREHHKNKINIVFHIFCGLVYVSLLLHLFGPIGVVAYTIFICICQPKFTAIFLALGTLLYLLHTVYKEVHLNTVSIFIICLVAYFAPEVSHLLTKENTVLDINSITLYSLVENFVMLLPYSIITLTLCHTT
jgi:hypothetical protein